MLTAGDGATRIHHPCAFACPSECIEGMSTGYRGPVDISSY